MTRNVHNDQFRDEKIDGALKSLYDLPDDKDECARALDDARQFVAAVDLSGGYAHPKAIDEPRKMWRDFVVTIKARLSRSRFSSTQTATAVLFAVAGVTSILLVRLETSRDLQPMETDRGAVTITDISTQNASSFADALAARLLAAGCGLSREQGPDGDLFELDTNKVGCAPALVELQQMGIVPLPNGRVSFRIVEKSSSQPQRP